MSTTAMPKVGRVAPNAPWPMVPLGELAANERNAITDGPFGSKLKTEHYVDSGPRVIRLTNIGDGEFIEAKAHISDTHFDSLQKHRVFAGDLVIAALGENPPRSCIIPESVGPAIVKADCIRFKTGPRILPKFLNFALNGPTLRRHAKGIVHGVGRPRLNLGEIKALPVPVPPIADQRRIVAEIEKQFTRLDAGVAALRRVQANLKRYRAAVLKAACEGRLVSKGTDWQETTLGAEATVLAGYGFPERLQGRVSGDIPFFKVGDISQAWKRGEKILNHAEHYITTSETKELRAKPLPTGTVVFAKIGAAIALNRRAILGRDSLVDNNVMGLAAGPRIDARFLFHFMCTQKLGELSRATTVPSVRKGDVEGIPLKLPSLTEQKRIVAEVERRLSVIDELDSLVTANLARAARLRQSVLERAFSRQPATEQAVATVESQSAKRPLNRHFARAVLSGEIVHLLHAEPTFGRIKHQKIFQLCEHIAQLSEIGGEYHREAAGPLDNRLIYANEAELKRQHWYQEVPRETGGHAYRPLAKAGGHTKYIEDAWAEKLPLVRRLIELMRRWDTERCEIFSTAYVAWNDLLIWKREPTNEAILHEILERWHPSKRRIPSERWLKAIAWMKAQGFAPTGFGRPTATPQ